MTRSILFLALLLAVGCASNRAPISSGSASPAAAPAAGSEPGGIRVVPVGRFDFESARAADPTLWPEELSGIVWVGGDEYLAIGDAHAVVHRLTVRIDPATGAIRTASTGSAIPLRDSEGARIPEPEMAEDREAITLDETGTGVWIANEETGSDKGAPSLAHHRLSDGRMIELIRCDASPMLRIFGRMRKNRGFEALARSPERKEIWTASEETLIPDGPVATASQSGLARLQKFDRTMRPTAQYAYGVDPYGARIKSPLLLMGRELSGLSELAALPDGRLLALERALGGDSAGKATLRSRLYLVDWDGATDVSEGALGQGLAGKNFRPVMKTLLWEKSWGLTNSNFEGMALGPRLENGDLLLLLVADNNAGTSQSLFPLRISGL